METKFLHRTTYIRQEDWLTCELTGVERHFQYNKQDATLLGLYGDNFLN